MTSYYTELDEALGDEEQAEEDCRERDREAIERNKEFSAAVRAEVRRLLPAKPREKPRGAMVKVTCKNKACGSAFEARVADRKRGWARFCSKSCKATHQDRHGGHVNREHYGCQAHTGQGG